MSSLLENNLDHEKPTNIHFIPNSHLDREWSIDFQHTRKLTVDFMSGLLDIMEQIPEYHFLLDSQAVPLEDYLEIMPENEARLARLIQSGRLHAGPWYTALDMNCLSGESIVRNMLYGHTTVEKYGSPMKVGYTPFGWGQQSQLPQMYKGFGIEQALFYRGITKEQVEHTEFLWEGADGTVLLTSAIERHFFYMEVWRPAFFSQQPGRIKRRLNWQNDRPAFRLCNEETRFDHGMFLAGKKELNTARLEKNFRRLVEEQKEHFTTGEIAFLHGFDTSMPDLREDEVVNHCREYLKEGEDFFYSSLPRYMEEMKKRLNGVDLPKIIGETRHVKMTEKGYSTISNDIISARTRQKALTSSAENVLQHVAEPFAAIAMLQGTAWPAKYFDMAWKQFLKCHPHDTIGGCSIDKVEEDATYRLNDTLSLSRMITKDSLCAVQSDIDTSKAGENAVVLTVFNPALNNRSEVVRAFVDVPCDLQMGEQVLVDVESGREVAFSSTKTGVYGKVYRDSSDVALGADADEYQVVFEAVNIPSMGYRSFTFKQKTGEGLSEEKIAKPGNRLENEYLRVGINPDGTFSIEDKGTGQRYSGMGYLEDAGECGGAWTHLEPRDTAPITSCGNDAEISVMEDSSIRGACRILHRLSVPETTYTSEDRNDWEAGYRSDRLVEMAVETILALDKGSRMLRVSVDFVNTAENHRLRICFPTETPANESFAEMPFDVVKRKIERGEDNPYSYMKYLTYPFNRFAGVSADDRHFSVVGPGLREYEVSEDE